MATASESSLKLNPEKDSDSDSDSHSDTTSSSKLNANVKCPVCLDYFDEPKLLPCAHQTCCKCLLNWLKAQGMPRTCPECRAPITGEQLCRLPDTMTPEEICGALPTDVSMVWLVHASRKLQAPHVCEKCQQEATSLCLTCSLKLCRECRRKHAKAVNKRVAKEKARRQAAVEKAGRDDLGLDENHPNIPYVALTCHRIKPLRDLAVSTVSRHRGVRCTSHQFEENWNDYYCETHEKFLCVQCVRESHGRCKVKSSKAKVKGEREKLAKQKQALDQQDELLGLEIERLRRREVEAERRSEALQSQLDGLMDKLVLDLRGARDKLNADLRQAEDLPAPDKARHQASVLSAFRANVQDLVAMKEAESLVSSFGDYSREVVQEVKNSTRGSQNSQQHLQNSRQNTDLSAEFQAIMNNLSAQVQEAVDDLQLVILPEETSATDDSDMNASSTAQSHISDSDTSASSTAQRHASDSDTNASSSTQRHISDID